MDSDYYEAQTSIIEEEENSYQDEGIMDQLREEIENKKVLKGIEEVFYTQNNGSSLNEDESIKYFSPSYYGQNNESSLNEKESFNYFFPYYSVNEDYFNKIENDELYELYSSKKKEPKLSSQNGNNIFTKKKRKSRKKNDNGYLRKDNIREKIKRRFFNVYLLNKLEVLRKKIKCKNYFWKFPSFFAKDVHRNRNKEILNITLREIFEKEELYNHEKVNGLNNYKHNLNVLQIKEIKENEEFKEMLNKTFYELYKEYLDDFKTEENKNLNNKKENENYIETYNNLIDNLMEFFLSNLNE